ncbi:hypothetical protein MKW92_032739 [Papaver armeniacum]|nr:hypothetical protein MKW92_032739 [Papaver armeniacum]
MPALLVPGYLCIFIRQYLCTRITCDLFLPYVKKENRIEENGPTYDQQLDAEQIQSLIDQRIKVLLGDAGSQHLDSCPQRPCLPVMLPTRMPTYGSQMPEAERILSLIDQRIKDHLGTAGSQQALIPGYGGQLMSMPPPGAPSMPMQMNGLLRPPTMGPPPTVPGGITPTSNAPPNPGVMHQGNPTALATGAFDGYNFSDAASGLQSPTQGSTAATSCLLTNEPGSSYLTEYVREAKKLAKGSRVCLGSWNVGSLTGKLREVVDTAARSCVNILCVQEIKWSGWKEAEVEDTGFKLWYKGGERGGGRKPNGKRRR